MPCVYAELVWWRYRAQMCWTAIAILATKTMVRQRMQQQPTSLMVLKMCGKIIGEFFLQNRTLLKIDQACYRLSAFITV
jgi:hypothetical protein